MSLRAWIWVTGIWWMAPLQILAVGVLLSADLQILGGLPLTHQARAAEYLPFTTPLTALAATVAGSRVGRKSIQERPIARPRAVMWLLPVAFITTAATLTSVALQLWAISQAESWAFHPALVVSVIGWNGAASAFGYYLGGRLPLRVATPVAVLVPYLVLAFPPAFEPLWLAHMFGVESGCCQVDQTPALAAIGASGLLAGAIVFTLFLFWFRPHLQRRWIVFPAALLLLPLAAATSASLVSGYGHTAANERSEDHLTCVTEGFTICTWPEHQAAIERASTDLRGLHARATELGLTLPERLVDQETNTAPWPTATFGTAPNAPAPIVVNSIILALMPEPDDACLHRLNAGDRADSLLAYSLARQASAEFWNRQLDPDYPLDPTRAYADELAAFHQLGTEDAVAALNAATEAITGCAEFTEFPP